jgi:hypothetical protein
MDNVINMFGNSTLFNNQGYGPADFEIGQAPLAYITENSEVIQASKHVIYRKDTGQELGIHGSRYSDLYDLSYKRMIDNQRNIIARSDLNTEGMIEDIQVSHNGAKCFVKHVLPNETITTPDGDIACLTLLSVSSLDATFPFICSAGARQSACMNGQVFVSKAANIYKSRHTKNLDIDKGAKMISDAVTILQKEGDLWHTWANHIVGGQEAFLTFAKAAKATAVFKWLKEYPQDSFSTMLLQPKIYGNTALMYMWNRWTEHYRHALGHNRWAVYNVMTDWSTHAPAAARQSQANIASISYKRSEAVRETIINSFKEAA